MFIPRKFLLNFCISITQISFMSSFLLVFLFIPRYKEQYVDTNRQTLEDIGMFEVLR